MDINELATQLAAIQNRVAEQDALAQRNLFMDKYGSRFSGDGNLGIAILGELNRRGIDVSAADDAVQQILDGLRMEATQLLDKIKINENAVSDMMDKMNTISEGVEAAKGQVEPAPPPPGPAEGMPPPGPAEGMPPEGMPPPGPAEGMPSVSPSGPAESLPPMLSSGPAESLPPEDMPPMPPSGPVPSDTRIKNIINSKRAVLSDKIMKKPATFGDLYGHVVQSITGGR